MTTKKPAPVDSGLKTLLHQRERYLADVQQSLRYIPVYERYIKNYEKDIRDTRRRAAESQAKADVLSVSIQLLESHLEKNV